MSTGEFSPLQEQLQSDLGSAYRLERELGGGGMSRVFLAEDTRLRRRVVVKVLAPELAAGMNSERFEREIQLAAALQHPHIVPVLAAGELDEGSLNLPYYTMPFVPGESLRARLRDGRMPLGQSVSVLRDVAKALSYAHKQGIVHRDIKPENVLLTDGAAVVTDFGIAKALSVSKTAAPGGTLTVVGTSLGTPAYMAPEQAAGDPHVDYRADLYAWGVMAYEVIAGAHPFASKTTPQQLLAAHLAERPAELLSVLSKTDARDPSVRRLAALVMRCLEKEASARPQSAGELLDALDSVVTPSGAVRAEPPSRAGRRAALGVAVVAVVCLLVAGVAITRHRETAPELAPKRVVVATFENRSGDASLDPLGAMAADWIARGLANTGVVDVAGTSAELNARGASTASVGPGAVERLALDARAGLVISGAYYKQGDSVLLQADFTDANARKLVQSVGPVSAPVARPLDGVERLRQRVTASLAFFVDSTLAGLASVTSQPPSEEAYREFLQGEELFYRDDAAAIQHFQRAAALDSSYAYPLLRLTTLYSNQGRNAQVDSVARIVARHRERLSPYEQAYLDYALGLARDDRDAIYRAGLQMASTAPKSAFAAYIRGITAVQDGRPREGDSVLRTLDPASGGLRGRIYYFANYTNALHALGEYQREIELARRARELYPPRIAVLLCAIPPLAALGRGTELNAILDEVSDLPADLRESPATAMTVALHELRFHGHGELTPPVRDRLLAWLTAHPPALTDTIARVDAALGLLAAEQWDQLQPLADSLARALPDDPMIAGLRGIALAMRGDRAGAQRVDAQLATRDPTYVRIRLLDARAGIAAALGDRAAAFSFYRQEVPPGSLDLNFAHGAWIFDRLRDYQPFLDYLKPRR